MAVGLCLFAGCAVRTPEQQTKHDDAQYNSALSPYQRDLKPGVSRKQVEDYLRSRNIPFGHSCCAAPNRAYFDYAEDDSIQLREEVRPWPCGSAYVYIAFVFIPQRPFTGGAVNRASEGDTLTGIHIWKIIDCV